MFLVAAYWVDLFNVIAVPIQYSTGEDRICALAEC